MAVIGHYPRPKNTGRVKHLTNSTTYDIRKIGSDRPILGRGDETTRTC